MLKHFSYIYQNPEEFVTEINIKYEVMFTTLYLQINAFSFTEINDTVILLTPLKTITLVSIVALKDIYAQ